MRRAGILALTFAVCLPAQDDAAFRTVVQPFFQKNCVACHKQPDPKGGVAFDALATARGALAARDVFERAIAKARAAEMPPRPLPKPKPEAVESMAAWFETRWAKMDRALPPDPGRVTARRLNRAEYNRTVRDLLGVALRPGDDFPADDAGYGFDNIGDVLSVSPVLFEKYLRAAASLAGAAVVVRNPPAPVLVRLNRAGGDPNVFEPKHQFPHTGVYEIRAGVSGERPKEVRNVRIALGVDGRDVQTFDVDIRDDFPRQRDIRVRLKAGPHQPRAELLDPHPNLSMNLIEVRGPFDAEPEPLTESHQRIISCGHEYNRHAETCARSVTAQFLRRAWRRPPQPSEVDAFAALVGRARSQGEAFEQGVRLMVQAALVSPHFLFRIEGQPAPGQRIRALGDYEIASRLSYFLWGSMPDEALLKAAEAGGLRTAAGLAAQVRRMIADPKAEALAEDFAGQWLQLRNVNLVKPDPDLFPEFDAALRTAMRRETELLFLAVLREKRSVATLLDSRETFLNARLARHYGIPNVVGDEFRRVTLPGSERAGVLTHASILTVTSYPNRTSPVIRGKYLLENFFNAPPPPPPANVPSLDEGAVGKSASLRQQLEKHRADAVCSSCHSRMDPLGFALENYDAIGRWRTRDGNFPIDASGSLPDGRAVNGGAGLRSLLRASEGAFIRGVSEKLLTYALGRGLERSDRRFVDKIGKQAGLRGNSLQAIIEEIVKSDPFRQIRAEQAAGKETVAP